MSGMQNARGKWVCVYCLTPWRRGHVCPPITPKPADTPPGGTR